MPQLWAPWRMAYLSGDGVSEPGCFLCTSATTADAGQADLVVWRGERVYALLNRYPYANGHVLVAPYRHEGDLLALDDDTAQALMTAVRRTIAALRRVYDPAGFNVGLNLGAAAGAGVADHVHLHVVPRWAGDTNFMTTTADIRVVPEALADTAIRLRRALADG